MNLTEASQVAGNFGEFFGAIAVVATLFYLAKQIREGSRATQMKNSHDLNESIRAWWARIADDSETASLLIRGLDDLESLSAEEKLRFSCLVFEWLNVAEELHFSEKSDAVAHWSGHVFHAGGFEEIVTQPGFSAWYSVRKDWLNPDFVPVIENAMARSHTPASWFTAKN